MRAFDRRQEVWSATNLGGGFYFFPVKLVSVVVCVFLFDSPFQFPLQVRQAQTACTFWVNLFSILLQSFVGLSISNLWVIFVCGLVAHLWYWVMVDHSQ